MADTFGQQARGFLKEPRKRLRNVPVISPPDQDGYPWGTVGNAIDYRIRYYFGSTPWWDLVSASGARAIGGETVVIVDKATGSALIDHVQSTPQEYLRFFVDLDKFLTDSKPSRKRLSEQDEDSLLRYCYVLALLEEVARAGFRPGTPLDGEFSGTEQFLELAQHRCIEDLRNMSWAFFDQFQSLLSEGFIPNPHFDGSPDVGGADADLVVARTLIDIKSTIGSQIKNEWLWQLLGYVLLDYSNEYELNKIGFYMTRQSILEIWDLDDVLDGLIDTNRPSLKELRTEFRTVAQGTR